MYVAKGKCYYPYTLALVLMIVSGVAMGCFCIVLLHELFGIQKHFLRQQEG